MAKIIFKEKLSESVFKMILQAPSIAEERKAGQFIMLQIDEDNGERIPLTIADASEINGTITIIFQVVGMTTEELAKLNEGDDIPVLVGPLGTPTHIKKHGTVVCVGGGIGVAPLHPIAKALKAAGNKIITIIGARTKDLIIMEEEMKEIADEFVVCTDDGSYGRKALVTVPLKEFCEKTEKPDMVIAIG
ncbi:MAG: sulfide/dihydroorotate dehydrogenase-like FAD/NAD-binding protein, partial [Melioribacteraceae bacterium]|nr:sulfide/dihydroorotate dehydrogenase-like FAD/NAD-binding protein [Melioribacteraceae bacterium]